MNFLWPQVTVAKEAAKKQGRPQLPNERHVTAFGKVPSSSSK